MTRDNYDASELIAKAIVWAAGQALQIVPVIGPVFRVVGFVNTVAEIRKAYAVQESTE